MNDLFCIFEMVCVGKDGVYAQTTMESGNSGHFITKNTIGSFFRFWDTYKHRLGRTYYGYINIT